MRLFLCTIIFMLIPLYCMADQINLALDDGRVLIYSSLEAGSEYSVHRNGAYVGKIVITESKPSYSVGIVTEIVEGFEMTDGDALSGTTAGNQDDTRQATTKTDAKTSDKQAEQEAGTSVGATDKEEAPKEKKKPRKKTSKKKSSSKSRSSSRRTKASEAEEELERKEEITEDTDTSKEPSKQRKAPEPYWNSEKDQKEERRVITFGAGAFIPNENYLEGQSLALSLKADFPSGETAGYSVSFTYAFPFEESFTGGSREEFQENFATISYIHYPEGRKDSVFSYGGGLTYFMASAEYRDEIWSLSDDENELGYHFLLRYNTPWNNRWFGEIQYQAGSVEDFDLGGWLFNLYYNT